MGRPSTSSDAVKTGQTPFDPLGIGPIATGRPPKGGYPVGTRRMSKAGYVNVKCGTMKAPLWESEARLVMERHLGRRLEDNEEVRHRRGVGRWDNRLEGLELWRDGRPVRIPSAAPRPRTNWKAKVMQFRKAFPKGEILAVQGLNADQVAAIEALLQD